MRCRIITVARHDQARVVIADLIDSATDRSCRSNLRNRTLAVAWTLNRRVRSNSAVNEVKHDARNDSIAVTSRAPLTVHP
jgi:hypothetical protein